MTVDIDLVERELRRIPEVRAARIVTDGGGMPVEVHVLATPAKHAKQLVRDVQSVAIASGGLEIDHRIVSVVQLEDEEGVRPPATVILEPTDRPTLTGVLVQRSGLRCTATVRLRSGDRLVEGAAEGSVAATSVRRAVADATLAALAELRPAAGSTATEAVSVVRIGDHEVAVVLLAVVVPPHEELLSGAAPVRAAGPDEAVARAVLAAGNRRLAR